VRLIPFTPPAPMYCSSCDRRLVFPSHLHRGVLLSGVHHRAVGRELGPRGLEGGGEVGGREVLELQAAGGLAQGEERELEVAVCGEGGGLGRDDHLWYRGEEEERRDRKIGDAGEVRLSVARGGVTLRYTGNNASIRKQGVH
jgi:hypothetical protein